MIELLIGLITLIPLDVTPSPSPVRVYPQQSGGVAAYLVGGFFGLGIIVLATILLGTKPRRARPPTLND